MIKSMSIIKKAYEDILTLPKYSFLNENPILQNISYMTISGSKAYGTNISTSDTDLRGFYIEPRESLLRITEPVDYYEDRVTDTVIYSLRKYVKLAAKCNPNVIEMLGTDNDHIWKMDKYGSYIRDSQTNPFGPSVGSGRVNRGGSWGNSTCRVAIRGSNTPGYRSSNLGLRLALQ